MVSRVDGLQSPFGSPSAHYWSLVLVLHHWSCGGVAIDCSLVHWWYHCIPDTGRERWCDTAAAGFWCSCWLGGPGQMEFHPGKCYVLRVSKKIEVFNKYQQGPNTTGSSKIIRTLTCHLFPPPPGAQQACCQTEFPPQNDKRSGFDDISITTHSIPPKLFLLIQSLH